MSKSFRWLGVWLLSATGFFPAFSAEVQETALLDIEQRISHGFATNNGVRIHYAALGQGRLVVMIHGFPDCWLTWRHLMEALAKDYETITGLFCPTQVPTNVHAVIVSVANVYRGSMRFGLVAPSCKEVTETAKSRAGK